MNIETQVARHKYHEKYWNFFLLIGLLPLLLLSCKKNTSDNQFDFKYNYFPLEVGHWVEYKVDSIYYNDFTETIDTFQYQLREVVESSFIDDAGKTKYRIERYFRDDSTDLWTIGNVWMAARSATTAEKIEENLRFIKLVFPIRKSETWDGNAHIQTTGELQYMQGWEYRVTSLDSAQVISGMALDSTLTVLQTDKDDLLERLYSTETYAKNVGLVYKKYMHLFKQNILADWDEAERGLILTYEMIDYRK